MDKISVVVPCYNEEEALPVYYKEMCRVMDEMKDVVFELIFVDDGSSDATLGIMKDLNEKDSRCRYLSFSRNFGKEAAIYAGLKASEGDYVALMDVDLQDPPTLLPEMYEILQEDAILYQKLLEILAPLETAFGVKLPKEEFANIIVILKKLRSLQQQPRRATSANAKHTAPPRWAKRSRAAQCC